LCLPSSPRSSTTCATATTRATACGEVTGRALAAITVVPGARTEEGLVVYRFGTSLTTPTPPASSTTSCPGRAGPAAVDGSRPCGHGDVDYTRRRSSPASSNTSANGTSVLPSALSSARCASTDRYGISATSAPAPTTTPLARHSEASHAAEGHRRVNGARNGRGGHRPEHALSTRARGYTR
jgi:hypothetical protein